MKKTTSILVLSGLLIGILIINSCKKDPVIPTLTSASVSNITVSSLTTGGSITADGGEDVTARGVCYSTTANPVVTGQHTSDEQGTGSFVSNISGLTPNTLYHIRAYATNSVGTAYGNEITATTIPIILPSLSTVAVTSITLTTAVTGGNITSDGNAAITARGVCWATTTEPTISGSKTADGTGSGAFVSNLTGLLPGTIYYIRSFATNSAGTAYGNQLTFTTTALAVPTLTTTAISSITLFTAVSGGNVTADGGSSVTARGVCWSTSANPTTTNSKTTDGTGNGVFTSNITGLTAGTLYHVRAYATNVVGTAYGSDISFTSGAIVIPTVTTTAASAVGQKTATSGGNVTADGGASVTARGVCWATTANPDITNAKTTDATGTGTFTSSLTNLLPGTLYHIRAYATNSAGTAYGLDLTFTTNPILNATITTTTVTSITLNTAISGGNISADGGGTITARGVCWSVSVNPTTSQTKTTDGTGTGSFVSNITGLLPGTTYHVRAYAVNSAGTAYGSDLQFTTSPVLLPTVTTTAVGSITVTTASTGGNVTSDGGAAITARGVCYSTSTNPTISDSPTSNGTGTGNYTSNLTGLTAGNTYYVKAYATNSAGTSYGTQVSFSTQITDIQSNAYNTVKIGTQLWMAENLRTTAFNTSAPILNITGNSAWADDTIAQIPAYCWFNNDIGYKPTFGAMYNWFAIGTGNLCPTGWHVPNDDEFNTLESFLGFPPAELGNWGWWGTNQGAQLKSTTGWAGGGNGTNLSGFNGLPGGYRYAKSGQFNDLGNLTYWWTSSNLEPLVTVYRRLDANESRVFRGATNKGGGKYVRCLKN